MIPAIDYLFRRQWVLRSFASTLLILFVFIGVARAQMQPEAPATSLMQLQMAPVIVDGEELFRVVGIRAYPAKRRAAEIADRIRELARDDEFDPKNLEVKELKDRTDIIGKGITIFTVLDEDAQATGVRRSIASEVAVEKIQQIIVQYRTERTPTAILKTFGQAAFWTALLLALLFGINWSFRRIDRFLERNVHRQIKRLEARSLRMVQAEQVWKLLRRVVRGIRILLILVLIYFFLNYVLTLFPWTRHFAHTLLDSVLDPLRNIAIAVINYIPSLIFLIILILIARYLLRALSGFFRSVARGRLKLERFESEWAMPTYRIVRLVVIVFTVVLAYPYIPGSDSAAFKGVSLFLGVLLSLGSTSAIANIVAGYTMTYRRAFRVGDRVRIGETVGDVTEMRLLVTHVRSPKNEEIVIPNSKILNSEVVNFSTLTQGEGLILHTRVGIGYEVPWRQVEAMLIMAALRTPDILAEPAPFVLQVALADYAVTYELNAYCKEEKKMMAIYSELHRHIQDVFNEYGIQIMTPSYVTDPPEAKVVAKDNWYAAPAKPEEEKST